MTIGLGAADVIGAVGVSEAGCRSPHPSSSGVRATTPISTPATGRRGNPGTCRMHGLLVCHPPWPPHHPPRASRGVVEAPGFDRGALALQPNGPERLAGSLVPERVPGRLADHDLPRFPGRHE